MTPQEEFEKSIELLIWDVTIHSLSQIQDRMNLTAAKIASKTCIEISNLLKDNRPEGPITKL